MHVPEALTQYRQFICWVARPSATPGKVDKIPYDPYTGRNIDPHDPANRLSAAEAVGLYQAGRVSGIGFVFTAEDPFFFFDLDDALQPDGQWSPLAHQMCQVFAGCFVEVSFSGKGLHIIGSGALPSHGCKYKPNKLELYTHSRFVALTCQHASGDPAHPAQAQLEWLASAYFPATRPTTDGASEWTDAPCDGWAGPEDDDELIARMLSSRGSAGSAFSNRATVRELWEADPDALGRCYPPNRDGQDFDHSSADAALCQHLAFWTGRDCERMDRLFRQSALYRDKWERTDYCRNTILHASSHCSSVYAAGRPASSPGSIPTPGGPILAPDAGGLRDGFQYLSVPQQQEYFAGCTYIQSKHAVLTPGGFLMEPERFKTMYGGYVFALDMINDKTTKSAWEAFTQSQGCNFPKAHTYCFRPELTAGAIVEEEGQQMVNVYHPIDTPATPGDASPMLDLIRRMLPNGNDADILRAYMAAVVQCPGKKFMWAPLLQGIKGNGKSLLATILSFAVGSRYTEKPDPNDISNKFNAWIERALLVIVDEVYVGDRRDMENALKRLITEKRITIQGKGADQITGDNRANFWLNTNYKAGIRIDDEERRYCVFFTAQQERGDIERSGMGGSYFPQLVDWLENGGYAICNHYLRTYQIPDALHPALNPRAPHTSSTYEAIQSSLGPIEQEVLAAVEEGRPGFAGGWISSMAFDRLLEDRRYTKQLPRNLRRQALQKLGYDWHPGLKEGRTNNIVTCPYAPGRTRLFVKAGAIVANLTTQAEIVRVYLEAQAGGTTAAQALGATVGG